ncbi:MAG: arylamine N-acetyltransferase [Lysobacterales bacterium 14-68-21]|jgi:N-hydroxyarylamine O-acetyltransferase|nr:MAG: arylamine N-acetyltransferase [Xanthomonadales bacterium 15-68-25]OZB64431.1 MAG: arylamine N-acetyltransferase [Xanthomonadales bacterium 14-68-21]
MGACMHPVIDVGAYARRIGFLEPMRADLSTVQGIVRAHVAAIAFENLDALMGKPIDLDPLGIEDKLVHRGRGGYCFEHNRLLAEVLRSLDLRVDYLLARVLWNRPDGAPAPLSHVALRVFIDDEPWLVDVGFGGLSLSSALRLASGLEQLTPHEPCRLLERDGEWLLQAQVAGQWRSLYRFRLQPCEEIDLAVANHYVSTHHDSPFTHQLVVARTIADQRLTLRNHEFTIHHRGGPSEHYPLPTTTDIRRVLERHFMLVLPAHAGLDRRLAALPR